ncbi:DUF805 domain-containing protein [Akkermansiaceae bacterium]|nr:DUF805 domain-containing protein [Akkermansiaceae bacterium]MDB4445367.1 DUF805 domain-containing protein [Akkermansiaceae bacterium]MDB4500151.1 DUF805 domain-containing protein [Akkermansiaceae bacterium]MDC0291410.1 DUF805 domain-containing protein [Akkermansiaceae bacterium]
MTIAQLEEWLIANNQQDQWWLQIDGSNLGQRVALEKAREILDTNRDARLSILHLSQQTLRPRPWIEIERMCSPSSPQEAVFSQEQAQQSSHAQVFPEPQREQAPKTVQIGRVETPPPPPPPPTAAPISPQKRKKVSFAKANYSLGCRQCGRKSQIKGKVLASRSSVDCPFCNSSIGLNNKNLNLELDESEVVQYRRIRDVFSYDGRVGVGGYWLGSLILFPLFFVAAVVGLIIPFIYPVLICAIIHPLWIKRLKDHGLNPAWVIIPLASNALAAFAILLLFAGETYPVLGYAVAVSFLFTVPFGVVVSLVPGKKSVNRFGPPVDQLDIKI